jgi:hypothetical protein
VSIPEPGKARTDKRNPKKKGDRVSDRPLSNIQCYSLLVAISVVAIRIPIAIGWPGHSCIRIAVG